MRAALFQVGEEGCAPSRCPAPLWDWPSPCWESIQAVLGGEPHTHACRAAVRQAGHALSGLRAPVGSQPRPPLPRSGQLIKVSDG